MTSHLNTYLSMPITEMNRHRNFNIDVVKIADEVDLSMHPKSLKQLAQEILDELRYQPFFHLYTFSTSRNAFVIHAKRITHEGPDHLRSKTAA